jgi:hypothetical protein
MRASILLVAVVSASGLGGWSSTLTAHGPVTNVTWVRDIGPLVQRRCAGCHVPGGVAALPLLDFEDVNRAAARIKDAVLARQMPPWSAAPGFGEFVNDRSLTAHEIQLLVSWVDGGKPKGGTVQPAASHPPVAHPEADLVLEPGRDTPIRSRRQRYVLRTREKTDRWIHAWRFTPGNARLVTQATVVLDTGEPLGVWVPASADVTLPDGVAQRLRAGAALIMEIEYAQPPDAATDRSSLALFFGSAPARELRRMDVARGTSTMAEAVELLAIRPRLESSGESVRVVAHRPDGTSEPLLWLRQYDEHHQLTYRLRRPVLLPAGSTVNVFSFDSTASVHLEFVRK